MSVRLRRNAATLAQLRRCSASDRKRFLSQHAKNDTIKCLAEIAHNILNSNVKLSQQQKAPLKRHAPYIRLLATKKLSLPRKRQLLVQRGGK